MKVKHAELVSLFTELEFKGAEGGLLVVVFDRKRQQLNEAFAHFARPDHATPWSDLRKHLDETLARLHREGKPAFQETVAFGGRFLHVGLGQTDETAQRAGGALLLLCGCGTRGRAGRRGSSRTAPLAASGRRRRRRRPVRGAEGGGGGVGHGEAYGFAAEP